MKILRRLTAAMLALVMVVTMLPVGALAEEIVGDGVLDVPETAETESAEIVETVVLDGPEAAETEAVETMLETTASTEAVETVPETTACEETWEIPEVITGETEKEINTAPKRNASRLLTEVRVYDELRNVTAKHVYSYNESGFLTGVVSYSDYKSEAIFAYDEDGRLLSKSSNYIDPYTGWLIDSSSEYTYNEKGQLMRVYGWQPNDGYSQKTFEELYEYDESGKCTQMTETINSFSTFTNVTEYFYDENGNLVLEITEGTIDSFSGVDTWSSTTTYEYDSSDRVIKECSEGRFPGETRYTYSFAPFVVSSYVTDASVGNYATLMDDYDNELTSFFFSNPELYNDKEGYLAKVVDTEKFMGDIETVTYEFYYDGELALPEGTFDASTELTGWQRAYYEFITENNAAWIIPPTYELLYVNDDSIPELYYYCGYGWGALLTYDTELHRIDVVHGSLTYNERSGVFISSCARQGYHMDSVYRLENGEAVSLAYGEYEINTNSPDYYWEGETITEEQYNQKKAEYVNPENALETDSDSSVVFDYDGILEWLKNYKIEEEETEADNSLIVFSDYSNLSICTNAIITLGVGIQKNGDVQSDLSGIAFQIADNTVLDVVITDYEDNFFYVKLRGLKAGNTTVTFSDSDTGETVAVPVSVSNRKVHSYALNDIPEKEMDGFPANFYNINGLYIDSYKYSVNDDQSANVSFDVYNSNYSYGVVEIYKENGEIHGVVLIDKAISSTTGFKEVLWDGVRYCIRDFANKTAFTYRQESGFSKKTPINIKIPKNGYIKICSDPAESLICGVVNAVDILMQLKSIKDELKDYGEHCFVFYKELTSKMLADETYALLLKDGSKAAEKFWKNVGKEIFISSDFMENTAMSIAKNIEELDLGNLIAETASDFGWDIGTDVFVHLAGPAGDAIKLVFAMGKTIDLLIEFTDLTQAIGGIKIYIQNQGGGVLSAQQIKVESQTDFPDKTALNVFQVTLDSLVLDAIKKASPELYEAVTNGKTYTYNISLLCSGKESQPDSPVTVYIPIPEDLKLLALAKKAKVYRTEKDGTMTEMNTKIQDGCFVFTTDHFSLYTIVGYDSFAPDNHDFSLGDVNHDTKINAKDATLILQKSVGVLKPTAKFCEECAEVSGDGKLNAKDSTLILQFSVGLRDSFPAGA